MPEPQILCRMCDNSVNKAVHGLAAILLVRLVGQPTKNVKNEICPHRCFAFYTRTARLNVQLPCKYVRNAHSENPRESAYKRGGTGVVQIQKFLGLGREKMGSVSLAPLHGSTGAAVHINQPKQVLLRP